MLHFMLDVAAVLFYIEGGGGDYITINTVLGERHVM